ncbi:hypothetical protein CLV40_112158 [Actinokineospora auranticolor]|uniref:Fibronectin type-III domain-containing protein n=1 Tax=Actinokineospora auranticolor TaxID=155976 RepID=A0A2S6GL34_9PSEU|nr:hypothetical protein CLV40_112158 [Actinokineospora auranticolor]
MRRLAGIAGGLVLLGAAIVVLRTPPEAGEEGPAPPPPAQTVVRQYAADGVVVPQPGSRPDPPAKVVAVVGLRRLQLWWGPNVASVPEPKGAAGYEVTWGRMGTAEYTRLVAEPSVQLDALDNNTPYDVEIRTIDSYGQRSQPAKTSATPQDPADNPPWSFNDRFMTRVVPDPLNWRFASTDDCGRATRGDGDDGSRLVISAQCGIEPVALRARPPLRLRDAPVNGELGRFVVETDHPGQRGELLLDLVPGPADLIAGSPNGAPPRGPAGLAVEDASLPPGAIRVRVAGSEATTEVQVVVAPGTPRLGKAVSTSPAPRAELGMAVRWEVVLRTDGVQVLRNGVVVGGGDVVPAWREATALVGFIGGTGGLYAGVSLVGFIGAPTAAPVLVVPPSIDSGRVVVAPDSLLTTFGPGERVPGTRGGQIRLTLVPQNGPDEPATDTFSVEVGGSLFPARPAVAGQPMVRNVRYPIVADVPPEALVYGPDGKTLVIRVRGPQYRQRAATRVISASVELIALEGAVSPAAGSGTDVPLPRGASSLPRPGAVLLDAAGNPVPEDAVLPSGRTVVEVFTDGRAGQLRTGRLASTAGVEVSLDGRRVAGIPTVVDGPGLGGRWRLALTTADLPPGRHSVEVKVLGTDPTTPFAVASVPFRIA